MKTTAFALLAALVAWVSLPPEASAAWFHGGFTGEEMLLHCRAEEKDPVKDFGRGICIGFIDGFAAGHFAGETYHAFHHRDERIDDIYGHLCIPETMTRGQLAKAFVQFLEKNPEKLKLPAGLVLEDALRDAFPCAGK
ncbi:MAG TPA: Rap1a/Tai family immunity protein [Burkholderiales bacterium]|nr:Rap1a/Tai family immunity protein [Burkholderiales bacterium]